ncbi:MAG: hypothetical protein IKN42_06260 [Elusimicrobia bacterium]|nr:hypothetical protein [Elusimicrobiota bacterium]
MNKNSRIMIFILNLLLFCGVAYVCYNYIYSKYAAVRNERKSVYEKFYNISKQLDDFVKIQTSMDEQKNSIMEPLSIYEDTFYSNEQNKTAYKVRILDLLKSLDITVNEDSIVQEQKGDNVSISVAINADYERVCKFLFELERYSQIDTIDMDYKGFCKIVTKPILFDSQINDCFSGRSSVDSIDDDVRKSGYFREIYDKILEVKDVGDIPSWRDFQPIPKNPFYYYVAPKKDGKGKGGSNKVNYGKPDKIVIDGIMYETKKPIVIIEGKFYYVGNTYKNCKIVKINENSINVNYYGKIYTIKMEN